MDLSSPRVPCFPPLRRGGSKYCLRCGCNDRIKPGGLCGHYLASTAATQFGAATYRRVGMLSLASRKWE